MTASALSLQNSNATANFTVGGSREISKPSDLVSGGNAQADKRLEEASRQFEAVLLRQMLSSLGRATGGTSGQAGGSTIYGSMVVDAVAEAVSRAGGLGLGSMLTKVLQAPTDKGVLNLGNSKANPLLLEPLEPMAAKQSPAGNSSLQPVPLSNTPTGRSQ